MAGFVVLIEGNKICNFCCVVLRLYLQSWPWTGSLGGAPPKEASSVLRTRPLTGFSFLRPFHFVLWKLLPVDYTNSFAAKFNFFKATICVRSSPKLEVSSVTYITSFSGLTMKLMIKTIDTSSEEFFAVLAWINLYFNSIVLFIINTMPSFTMSFQVLTSHHLFAN